MGLLLRLSAVWEVWENGYTNGVRKELDKTRGCGRRNIPVIFVAEPPLHADIMMRSSMIVSLIFGLPDCTINTSFSRTLVKIRTLVSPYSLLVIENSPELGYSCRHRSLADEQWCSHWPVDSQLGANIASGRESEMRKPTLEN